MALPAGLPRKAFSGKVHRVVRAGFNPTSTAGSLRTGGRYNPPGEFAALYTSLTQETAAAEVARNLRLRGVDPGSYGPQDWWAYEFSVSLTSVLDLTDTATLEMLGLPAEGLAGPDVEPARMIAAEARAAGYQALLVPSAALPGEKNLVIFADLLAAPPEPVASRPVRPPA